MTWFGGPCRRTNTNKPAAGKYLGKRNNLHCTADDAPRRVIQSISRVRQVLPPSLDASSRNTHVSGRTLSNDQRFSLPSVQHAQFHCGTGARL